MSLNLLKRWESNFFGNGGSASDAEHLATEFIIKFIKILEYHYPQFL